MNERITGIYKIVNTVNGHMYVGSATNIKVRWRKHKSDLKRSNHHSQKLQRAWNKYGEEAFEFSVIEECEPIKEIILGREQFWIDYYKACDNHNYNVAKVAGSCAGCKATEETRKILSEINRGELNSFYGKHHSEETKKLLSDSAKGRTHSQESIEKMSKAQKGRIVSAETREKMSKAQKGKIIGDETREKISIGLTGKSVSPDTKIKMSKAHKGKTFSEETKIKMSKAQKGKIVSAETRAKLSESAKVRHIGVRNPFYGKKHSEETKVKMSASIKKRLADKKALKTAS